MATRLYVNFENEESKYEFLHIGLSHKATVDAYMAKQPEEFTFEYDQWWEGMDKATDAINTFEVFGCGRVNSRCIELIERETGEEFGPCGGIDDPDLARRVVEAQVGHPVSILALITSVHWC